MGTLVFDGDCGFCTSSARWAQWIAPGLVTVPWQQADLDAFGISKAAAAAEVQYVDRHGNVSAGAAGIARLFVERGGLVGLLGRVMSMPGIRRGAALTYRIVSKNRHRLPGGMPACKLDAPTKDG